MKSLDYELYFRDGEREWQVWTPDECGACIGGGNSKTTALRDAIENLEGTINLLNEELRKLTT